ncbi:MAG TPA: 16S rRNA (adenine(1518)-N(6)/adenine(1519)-N(6))-dimethyltransferase RsmA [Elusimicrobiota bacterium]|nr:16S rRNA (adenine(1518)-N(6)/adenine(1519)-N(6))-dimethyltransferase RsmA [Elusimicrobiota bacterium]
MRPPLGQHFLRDPRVLQTIVAAAELNPDATVLEIGPGRGALTERLVPRVRRLIAVELDATLAEHLGERWGSHAGVTIVRGDFLKQDLDLLLPAPGRILVLGNLPYAITSPIFAKLLQWPRWDTGVFLIQREVAERIASGPGSKAYGILSLAVQAYADTEIVMKVKPGAFQPPPRVTSAVLRLRRKPVPDVAETAAPAFFDLIHGAFAHRRKTLANSLALFVRAERPALERWLQNQGVDPASRAETVRLADYARIADAWAIFRREINLTTPAATSTIPEQQN